MYTFFSIPDLNRRDFLYGGMGNSRYARHKSLALPKKCPWQKALRHKDFIKES